MLFFCSDDYRKYAQVKASGIDEFSMEERAEGGVLRLLLQKLLIDINNFSDW